MSVDEISQMIKNYIYHAATKITTIRVLKQPTEKMHRLYYYDGMLYFSFFFSLNKIND